ncbi:GNAT family N-acetyltransferase [Metabacillus malikii]|uniref:Ribosomal protein S18 acetylase RimI-like enzyme n=1 Tax=Metabacillus malikii TaxID=1504265 RepID=A0ABT9ZCZ7_9BACI|nr:GNAT family N-acetyltransferase [Metabacillus malikii]MDQ0230123.1 ribosomal protein S18 acetylase RimI-like enzyme [Metabacillus malikii]
MEIYQATLKDLDEIANLFNSYRIFYQQHSDLEGAKAFLKDRIENKQSIIFVAKDNDIYLGFTQLYPTFSSVSMKRAWILNDLYVEKTARKQGIGELLLQKAKQYANETNAKSLSLCTAHDNKTAQRLYEKNGYIRDEQYYHYNLRINN